MVSHGMRSAIHAADDQDSALRRIEDLLEEWRILTEAESAAINSENWSELEILHEKKAAGQVLIEKAEFALVQDETLSVSAREDVKKRFRSRIESLIQLEGNNRDLLARKMAQAEVQLKVSDRTMRSLRHVQQAYGVGSRSFWHSYS